MKNQNIICEFCNNKLLNNKLITYCEYCKEIMCPNCISFHVQNRNGIHCLVEFDPSLHIIGLKYNEKEIKNNFEKFQKLAVNGSINIAKNLICNICSYAYLFKINYTDSKFKINIKCLCNSKEYSIPDFINTFKKKYQKIDLNEKKKVLSCYKNVYQNMIDKKQKLFNVVNDIINFSLKNNKKKEEVNDYINFIYEGLFLYELWFNIFFNMIEECHFNKKNAEQFYDLYINYSEIDFDKIIFFFEYFYNKIHF